jgi:hypothetical protein
MKERQSTPLPGENMRYAIFVLLFIAMFLHFIRDVGHDQFGPRKGRVFVYRGQYYGIVLPDRVKARSCVAKEAGYIFDFKPVARSPMYIIINVMPLDKELPKPLPNMQPLIITNKPLVTEGGSGGPEVTLAGKVTFPGQTLVFSCHYQNEDAGTRDAFWCLKYLETLRPFSPGLRFLETPLPAEAGKELRC